MGAIITYLAGKISMNDWRKCVVMELRGHVINVHDIYDTSPANTYIDGLYVSGPFFIACDHGCYHGHETHGVGAYDPNDCMYEHGITPELCEGAGVPKNMVPKLCMEQIDMSNFVFAYIDSDTCYGTLLEIGYAIGNKIPVAVMFSNRKLCKDMWFIAESASIVFNHDGYLKKSAINDGRIFDASQKIARLIASGGDK
jgi:hypothetical protein